MKYQDIRKKFLLESAVIAAVLSVLGGAAYFLSTLHDDSLARKATLEGEVSAVTNETNGLREKFIRIQNNKDLYQMVMALSAEDQLSLNSEALDAKFREFKYRYNFNSFVLEHVPSASVPEDAKYKRKTQVIETRDAILTFDGLNDEDLYSMIQAMGREIPGSARITSLKVERQSRLTNEAMRAVTKSGSFPLIKGELKFTWFGIGEPGVSKKPVTKSRKKRR